MSMKAETAIERLKRLAREKKAQQLGTPATALDTMKALGGTGSETAPEPETAYAQLSHSKLTPEQLQAVHLGCQGYSFCMTGAAGTGKTTTTNALVTGLIQSGNVPILQVTHRYLKSGAPGIVGCAFTNKAVQNIKRVMPTDLQNNFITIHKLLEFQPVYWEEWDPIKSKYVNRMEFRPARNEMNPLPESLKVLIIEEATMVSVELWNQIFDALPVGGNIQIILIGDIQQLPPVFGKSIFIYAMQSGMRIVELTKVHRQALDSPILELAHRVLSGKVLPVGQFHEWNKESSSGKLKLVPWKKDLTPDIALRKVAKDFLPAAIEAGEYDPYVDCILTPYNKAFGTIELNIYLATYLAQSTKWNPDRNPVHEVIGGVNTKYFRVGDKVLWNKTEHRIIDIKVNARYYEKEPKIPSVTMDYRGTETDETAHELMLAMLDGDQSQLTDEHINRMDKLLESFQAMTGDADANGEGVTTRQCSHIITVESEEFGESKIQTSGDLALLDLAYAITVHKSQGSEYRRVFLVTHKSQATMLFRELLYTAITRAKEELTIIGPPSLFVQGITSQRLPGRTLAEKLESFNRWIAQNKVGESELPRGMALLTKGAEIGETV